MQNINNIRNDLNESLYSLQIYEYCDYKYSGRLGHYILGNVKGVNLKMIIDMENNIDNETEYQTYVYIENNTVMIIYVDERRNEHTYRVYPRLFITILFNAIVRLRNL
jgi:hypothetical protein